MTARQSQVLNHGEQDSMLSSHSNSGQLTPAAIVLLLSDCSACAARQPRDKETLYFYLTLLVLMSTNNIHLQKGNKLFSFTTYSDLFTPCPYIISFPTAQNSTLGPGLLHKKVVCCSEFSAYICPKEPIIQAKWNGKQQAVGLSMMKPNQAKPEHPSQNTSICPQAI